MTHEPLKESRIFCEAVKLPEDQRNAYLQEACGGDEELRRELESLLKSHQPAGEFLESPAIVETVRRTIPETAGSSIGPYKLREKIGEGGFGVVYVAEQEAPVRRRVALKIIKHGMDTNEVIARFRAEQQALAMMDHPNVARVLDAGTTVSGLPYFVMELVPGVSITEYCDRNHLPTRERLALLSDVCKAIQHAHQKGIIHRDIKPSNVMVTLHDGRPVVKVIDFGISKAINQQLSEQSIYTAFGQMIGTPAYMSPEQAEMSGLGIDTRSDIYSLGILMYELLTGETPLNSRDLRERAYGEILRLIREDEPFRPSRKVSTLGEKATVVARHRQTDPRQLQRELSGELDWIVMKCLEKERNRRYETANGLARDIDRYLADEPVEACPPSLRYRLRKAARRHRGPLIAAGFVLTALCIGIIGTTYGLLLAKAESESARISEERALAEAKKAREAAERELQQRQRADSEAAASRAVRNFLQEDLLRGSSGFEQAEAVGPDDAEAEIVIEPTILQLLERALKQLSPDRIDAKLGPDRFVQAEVLTAVGDAMLWIDEAKAIEPLERAVKLYEAERGPDDPSTLAARHALGFAMWSRSVENEEWGSRMDPAEERRCALEFLEDVLEDRIRVLGPWHLETAETRDIYGRALMAVEPARAVEYFNSLSRESAVEYGDNSLHSLKARFHACEAMAISGQPQKALVDLEELMKAPAVQNARPDHPYYVNAFCFVALLQERLGQSDKSIASLEKVVSRIQNEVGKDNAMLFVVRHTLGWVYFRAGKSQEAITAFSENLRDDRTPGRRRAMTLAALAHTTESSDVSKAIDLYEQSRLMRIEFSDGNSMFTQRFALDEMMRYVHALQAAGRHAVAVQRLDEVLAFHEKYPREALVDPFRVKSLRLRSIAALGDIAKADEGFSELAKELEGAQKGAQKPELEETLRQWSLMHEGTSQNEKAIELTGRLIELRRGSISSSRRPLAESLRDLGRQLIKSQRYSEAEPVLREALTLHEQTMPESWLTVECRAWLALSIAGQENRSEAVSLLLKAFQELTDQKDRAPVWGQDRRLTIATRLMDVYQQHGDSEQAAHWKSIVDSLTEW